MFDHLLNKQNGLFRERVINADHDVDFSSNDYLSLSAEPVIRSVYQRAFSNYSPGSGGSMLIGGYQPTHRRLEAAFCEALDTDAALLFSSGYAANLSVMALCAEAQLTAFFDKTLHASFYDGLKMMQGKYHRYPHQAYDVLQEKLSTYSQRAGILIAESVCSMGGHFSPLDHLATWSKSLAGLIVDEAHAFGLYGKEGLGSVVHFGLTQEAVPLRIIPLGKGLHAQGAIVTGKADWIEALIQVARSYIYSTGISPAYAAGLLEVFKWVRQADERREALFENVRYFKKLTARSDLHWLDSSTPIQHLISGCPHRALAVATHLGQQGIFCRAIRPPTVPAHMAGLRVVLNAGHTHTQLDRLIEVINTA